MARIYNHGAVLLLYWADTYPAKPFSGECEDVARVFREDYRFSAEIAEIPSQHSEQDLAGHVQQFVDDHAGKQTLLVIYYSGHGGREGTSHDLLWSER